MTKSQGLFIILALVLPPGSAQTAISTRLEVTVSVYDYAHVPAKTLAKAKQEVQRIFHAAGIETVWVSCLPKPEKIELNSCSVVDATHLVLKILPHGLTTHVRDRLDVIGNALLDENGTGNYACVFLDHIQALEGRLGFALMAMYLLTSLGTCCWARIPIRLAESCPPIGLEQNCGIFPRVLLAFFQANLIG